MGTHLFIHQARYSMFDRWVEKGLLDELGKQGTGAIAFSPLEQGVLTNRYLKGFPKDSRAIKDARYLTKNQITSEVLSKVQQLNELAQHRGQTLAQMAIAWLLRKERVASVLVGVSKVEQLKDNIKALEQLSFSEEELDTIEAILDNG